MVRSYQTSTLILGKNSSYLGKIKKNIEFCFIAFRCDLKDHVVLLYTKKIKKKLIETNDKKKINKNKIKKSLNRFRI